MTAFLFLASTRHARLGRRVDLANFASLFGDRDEPPLTPPRKTPLTRVALVALLLIGAIGDTVVIARPDMLANVTGSHGPKKSGARSISF